MPEYLGEQATFFSFKGEESPDHAWHVPSRPDPMPMVVSPPGPAFGINTCAHPSRGYLLMDSDIDVIRTLVSFHARGM